LTTYSVVLVAFSLELDELLFLLPVVVGADPGNDEDTEEDGEALNPSYIIIISIS
jgi:hypothetical protein